MSDIYRIMWRNYGESKRLFQFNPDTLRFEATQESANAQVEYPTGGVVEFYLLDNKLLASVDGTIRAVKFSEKIIPGDYPRLDFERESGTQTEILGSIHASGILYMRRMLEADSIDDEIKLLVNCTIRPGGIWVANEFREETI